MQKTSWSGVPISGLGVDITPWWMICEFLPASSQVGSTNERRSLGFGWAVIQTQPSHRGFNEMRKIFRKAIGPQSVSDFDSLIEQEAASFVQCLSGFSGDPLPIIQKYAFLIM
jgi:hypothetical protein